MSMPSAWINRLFARLGVHYGAAWTRMWEGPPMEAVRADWAEKLSGLEFKLEAIRYGLDNLPDYPPTAVQFRAACNRMPEPMPVALPQPPASPEVVAKVVGAFVVSDRDPLAWAYRLKAREINGDRLLQFQRDAWREALSSKAGTDAPEIGQFSPISEDVLPPGMRS
jgi:hypothetical protein